MLLNSIWMRPHLILHLQKVLLLLLVLGEIQFLHVRADQILVVLHAWFFASPSIFQFRWDLRSFWTFGLLSMTYSKNVLCWLLLFELGGV